MGNVASSAGEATLCAPSCEAEPVCCGCDPSDNRRLVIKGVHGACHGAVGLSSRAQVALACADLAAAFRV